MQLVLPRKESGISLDIKKRLVFTSTNQARKKYATVSERLLNVNDWNKIMAVEKRQYMLFNSDGVMKYNLAQVGDFIRFNLPVPKSSTGSGYDWVRIEKILREHKHEWEFTAMEVRPSSDPTTIKSATAHFYTSDTTNTFIVERYSNTLSVSIHPRNEHINMDETNSLFDKLRNISIGVMSWLGVSKTHWRNMINGLCDEGMKI